MNFYVVPTLARRRRPGKMACECYRILSAIETSEEQRVDGCDDDTHVIPCDTPRLRSLSFVVIALYINDSYEVHIS